jgi:ferritin-like metal-binding protein YciE
MNQAQQKIVQYLNEAHGMERALVRVLQSQIAMAPRGSYRNSLQSHLQETYDHAERVKRRLSEMGDGNNPLQVGIGLLQSAIGQALALGKAPVDLVRGSGRNEKVLKNAKDACATEALEIATYTAIEHLAEAVGDRATAALAASIRADEQRMLDRLIGELPRLTDAVLAEIPGAQRRKASPTRQRRKASPTAQRRKASPTAQRRKASPTRSTRARGTAKTSRKPASRRPDGAKRSARQPGQQSDADRNLANA